MGTTLVGHLKDNLCSIEIGKALVESSRELSEFCRERSKLNSSHNHTLATYYALAFPDQAAGYLGQLVEKNPQDHLKRLLLGQTLWNNNERNAAIAEWRRIPSADVYFAHLSGASSNIEQAQEMASIAEEVNPVRNLAKRQMYTDLCLGWRRAGRADLALPWCRAAADVQHNGWTHIELATTQYILADYDAALESLALALQFGPESTRGPALRQIGEVYLSMRRPEDAKKAYRSAIEMGYSTPLVHLGLAMALQSSGSIEEACREYLRALDLGYEAPRENNRFSGCH